MTRQTFLFHGLRLTMTADAPVLAALRARLQSFPILADSASSDLQLEWVPVPNPSRHVVQTPMGRSRMVMQLSDGEVRYFEASEQLYAIAGDWVRMLCHAPSGCVQVSYVDSTPDAIAYLSHPLLTIPLQELLKRRGLFMLHAATLADHGRGVLLAGASGTGKTTLALALLRGGLDFLGDDTIFLSSHGEAWHALAFPDEIDATAQTLAFFPELAHLGAEAGRARSPKFSFPAGPVYLAKTVWECAPKILVFPQPSGRDVSEWWTLSKDQALLQLVSNLLRTDPMSTQRHFDALAGIVRQCDCYQLHTGRDFAALPSLIRGALENASNRSLQPVSEGTAVDEGGALGTSGNPAIY